MPNTTIGSISNCAKWTFCVCISRFRVTKIVLPAPVALRHYKYSGLSASEHLDRASFGTPEMHLGRQASSESAFERIGNAFGSTGVERERISTLRKRIWIDRRRARASFGNPEMHLGRQASSESAPRGLSSRGRWSPSPDDPSTRTPQATKVW